MFDGVQPSEDKLKKVHEALGWLDNDLTGCYITGEVMTVADFSLVASIATMVESGVDFSKYKNILKWYERCQNEMTGYDEANGDGAKKFGAIAKNSLSKFSK